MADLLHAVLLLAIVVAIGVVAQVALRRAARRFDDASRDSAPRGDRRPRGARRSR